MWDSGFKFRARDLGFIKGVGCRHKRIEIPAPTSSTVKKC